MQTHYLEGMKRIQRNSCCTVQFSLHTLSYISSRPYTLLCPPISITNNTNHGAGSQHNSFGYFTPAWMLKMQRNEFICSKDL